MGGSSSSSCSSSSSGKQTQLPISQNRVVYVGVISRKLKNVPARAGSLYHQAILAVTSDSQKDIIDPKKMEEDLIGSKFEFHILEYMDDGKVHVYQVEITQKFEYCDQVQSFDDGEFTWDTKSMDFYIRQMHITIQQIKEKMQKLADHGGKYDLLSHNCQNVAWKMLMYIIKYNTFFYAEKYQFKKDYQRAAGMYFMQLIKNSTQIYSILKLRELKQLIKENKDVRTFKL